jgi:electron transfer flavoprotein alpha subunit
MAKVLLIAEHDGESLNPNTAKCVACATAVPGAEIDVAVFAESAAGIAAEAAILE